MIYELLKYCTAFRGLQEAETVELATRELLETCDTIKCVHRRIFNETSHYFWNVTERNFYGTGRPPRPTTRAVDFKVYRHTMPSFFYYTCQTIEITEKVSPGKINKTIFQGEC